MQPISFMSYDHIFEKFSFGFSAEHRTETESQISSGSSHICQAGFFFEMPDEAYSCAPLSCGVPHGSILGPLFFTIYMVPLTTAVR